jgi:hypothetical protein
MVDVIAFLKDNDDSFAVCGNVFHASKAFKANALIQFCINARHNGEITDDELDIVVGLLRQYLNNEVEIYWDEKRIIAQPIEVD